MSDPFAYFRKVRWKKGKHCPFCAASRYRYHSKRRSGVHRYECLHCTRIFSDVTGTFLHGSKIPLITWCAAVQQLSHDKNITPRKLQRHIGVSYPTALRVWTTIRRGMRMHLLNPQSEKDLTYPHLLLRNFKKTMPQM